MWVLKNFGWIWKSYLLLSWEIICPQYQNPLFSEGRYDTLVFGHSKKNAVHETTMRLPCSPSFFLSFLESYILPDFMSSDIPCVFTQEIQTLVKLLSIKASAAREAYTFPCKRLPPRSDKLQNSIIQIVTHVWQRLTFRHVNPFCVGPRLQPNGSNPDLLTVIRAGGRAIVRLPVRTLLGAWLKAVNTKLFKVNLQPAPLTEANQCTINVRLVRLSSK